MAFGDLTVQGLFPRLTGVDYVGGIGSGENARGAGSVGGSESAGSIGRTQYAGDIDGFGLGTHIPDGEGNHFTQIPGKDNSYAKHTKVLIG